MVIYERNLSNFDRKGAMGKHPLPLLATMTGRSVLGDGPKEKTDT